jgi:hypothetical protein
MKTAVEWLVHELGLDCTTDHEDEIHEALEMEKEQISKAYFEGWSCPHGEGFPETGEQYYNKTFKQKL